VSSDAPAGAEQLTPEALPEDTEENVDDEFLPDVDLEHGNLTYTVVLGEVLGNWEAEEPSIGAS